MELLRGVKAKPSLKNIRKMKYSMMVGYVAIMLTALLFLSVLAIRKTDIVLRNKVSSLVSSLNVQMKLNMDSYLSRMETIGTLAFAEELTYTYDATDPNNDEYEALNIEKTISDKLYSLCIMENFVDYGIVYRNNHLVGKISNGTTNLFGDKIFEDLSKVITRKRTRDGWAAGYMDNFKRIYYVKRIHDNALLVISFYTAELESVFDNPETMNDITIRLTNQDYNILYSSDGDELGLSLPYDVMERVQNRNSATVMDNDYLVTVNSCGDDWYVICSVPTKIILNEKNEMELYIVLIACVAGILSAVLAIVLSVRMTRPVESYVSTLDEQAHIDRLTGILNKISFEEYTKSCLEHELPTVPHVLILVDLDNFKGVNDTLGHAYGDKVLANVGRILMETFSESDYLGRIGGDEFCVLMNTPAPKGRSYREFIEEKCQALCEQFHNNYTGDDGKYKVSASIGAACFPECGRDFAELYAMADKALYSSKERGKDTYTIAETEVKS